MGSHEDIPDSKRQKGCFNNHSSKKQRRVSKQQKRMSRRQL